MTKAKMMPRLLREIVETILDIHLDLGNWLQGFLPWEVPDGLYTTIAPNCFAIIQDLANHYPKSEDVALVRKLMSAFAEFARTRRPFPAPTPDDEANLRFCCRTIIEGYTAKLYPAYWNLVRWVCRNPFRFLTALRIVRRTECLSERVKGDILAVCDYDTANRPLALMPKDAGYVDYAIQAACNGAFPAASARSAILNAAIAPARRKVRAESGTFVGEEGAKNVKEVLDGLAAELNAPRFGKAGKILKGLGMDIEWDFAVSLIPTDEEIAGIKKCLMDGEIPFNAALQNKLCVVLGVEAYNAFVTEYNGK